MIAKEEVLINKNVKIDLSIPLKNNSIIKLKPELFSEWDFEKNDELGLNVYTASKGSDKYAWWICPKCTSSYENRISNRFNGKKCSYCGGKKVNHTNSLGDCHPDIASQWHPTKNGIAAPNTIAKSSNRKVWWLGECEHEWEALVSDRTLKNAGCPYCARTNRRILIGYNDLWTTHPHIAKMLASPDLGYKYSYGSDVRCDWKCLNCNNISKDRAINDVSDGYFSCNYCSDGLRYPEKFMSNLLSYLKIDFLYQKSFSWSNKKVYDFYIPSINTIIEMHGEQHSIVSGFERMGGETLAETQANDKIKKEMAFKNLINQYVEINCIDSNFELIKNNTLNSCLSSYFDLDSFNWNSFRKHLASYKSKLVQACEIYNTEKITKKEIAERLNISMPSLFRYLNIGNEIGLCEFKPYSEESKKISSQAISRSVIQISPNGKYIEEYESVTDARIAMDVVAGSRINECCKNKNFLVKGYRWFYKEDYLDIVSRGESLVFVKPVNKNYRKVVQLSTNGEYIASYDSLKLGAEATNSNSNHISRCCKGRQNYVKGFKWMYKEDYEFSVKNNI